MLYVAPNDLGLVRVGITVSSRIGKAVVRNRTRRRIREALRARWSDLRAGRDLLVVARPPIARATWPQIVTAVQDVLTRAGQVGTATECGASSV